MQRKTAVAAATAISMGLASATIAIGASFGALGFASSAKTLPQPTAVHAAAPTAGNARIITAARATEPHEEGDGSNG